MTGSSASLSPRCGRTLLALRHELLDREHILVPTLPDLPPPDDIHTPDLNLANMLGFQPANRQSMSGDTAVGPAWQFIESVVPPKDAVIQRGISPLAKRTEASLEVTGDTERS